MSEPLTARLEPDPEDERSQLERSLRALVPAASRVDRDRLMYLAGQAAAGSSSPGGDRAWRRRARLDLALASIGSLLAGWLISAAIVPPWHAIDPALARKGAPETEKIRDRSPDAPMDGPGTAPVRPEGWKESRVASAGGWYLQARNHVLAQGVDAWSEPSAARGDVGDPADPRRLRSELLDRL